MNIMVIHIIVNYESMTMPVPHNKSKPTRQQPCHHIMKPMNENDSKMVLTSVAEQSVQNIAT